MESFEWKTLNGKNYVKKLLRFVFDMNRFIALQTVLVLIEENNEK
jgi:hypothetical protein